MPYHFPQTERCVCQGQEWGLASWPPTTRPKVLIGFCGVIDAERVSIFSKMLLFGRLLGSPHWPTFCQFISSGILKTTVNCIKNKNVDIFNAVKTVCFLENMVSGIID